jgi:hypothetical protein
LCGRTQTIKVKSNQPGADVYINNVYTGKQTPCKVEVKRRMPASDYNRRKELIIELKKDGYKDARQTDYAGINGLLVVDFGLGFWPGIVDIATGSHLRFHRNFFINMAPEEIHPPLKAKNEQTQMVSSQVRKYNQSSGSKLQNAAVYDSQDELSDVDMNIPKNDFINPNRFALVIGNEDYANHQPGLKSEANVKYAANDAFRFSEYCKNTWASSRKYGFYYQCHHVEMSRGITKMNLFAKSLNGEAEIIFTMPPWITR